MQTGVNTNPITVKTTARVISFFTRLTIGEPQCGHDDSAMLMTFK